MPCCADCSDLYGNCARWAAQGLCDPQNLYNGQSIRYVGCPTSCGTCGESLSKSPSPTPSPSPSQSPSIPLRGNPSPNGELVWAAVSYLWLQCEYLWQRSSEECQYCLLCFFKDNPLICSLATASHNSMLSCPPPSSVPTVLLPN